jgi:hypothetical protein
MRRRFVECGNKATRHRTVHRRQREEGDKGQHRCAGCQAHCLSGPASAVGYRLLFCVTQGYFDGHAVPGTRASLGRRPATGEGCLPLAGSAFSSRCAWRIAQTPSSHPRVIRYSRWIALLGTSALRRFVGNQPRSNSPARGVDRRPRDDPEWHPRDFAQHAKMIVDIAGGCGRRAGCNALAK